MRTSTTLLLAAGLLGSVPALAQPWNPIGRTDKNGNPGVAVIPENLSVPIADDPWTEATARRIYDSGLGPRALFSFVELVWPVYDWGMNDFDNKMAQQLADGCRNRYPGDSWRQINCASQAVEMLLDKHDMWSTVRTPCRSHARAFMEVVDRLDIPGVRVSQLVMPYHVLNRLFVTTPTGQVFQYAVDVGWNEDRVYPHNDAARRWHDHNGDGITDFTALPPLPVRGQRIDYSFRAATPSSGTNVSRNAATRGGVSASGAGRVSTAAGAGIPR